MNGRWLTTVVCVALLVGMLLSLGCSSAFTPDRVRRRAYVVQTDKEHMIDDIDWALGLDEPSILYDETMPPYPYGRLSH